jgi:hypothetical protein
MFSIPEESPTPLKLENMELVVSSEDTNEKLLASFDHEEDLSVGDSVRVEKDDDEFSYDNDDHTKEAVETAGRTDFDYDEARDEMNDRNETTEQNAPSVFDTKMM